LDSSDCSPDAAAQRKTTSASAEKPFWFSALVGPKLESRFSASEARTYLVRLDIRDVDVH
jgi:hypothetical protein